MNTNPKSSRGGKKHTTNPFALSKEAEAATQLVAKLAKKESKNKPEKVFKNNSDSDEPKIKLITRSEVKERCKDKVIPLPSIRVDLKTQPLEIPLQKFKQLQSSSLKTLDLYSLDTTTHKLVDADKKEYFDDLLFDSSDFEGMKVPISLVRAPREKIDEMLLSLIASFKKDKDVREAKVKCFEDSRRKNKIRENKNLDLVNTHRILKSCLNTWTTNPVSKRELQLCLLQIIDQDLCLSNRIRSFTAADRKLVSTLDGSFIYPLPRIYFEPDKLYNDQPRVILMPYILDENMYLLDIPPKYKLLPAKLMGTIKSLYDTDVQSQKKGDGSTRERITLNMIQDKIVQACPIPNEFPFPKETCWFLPYLHPDFLKYDFLNPKLKLTIFQKVIREFKDKLITFVTNYHRKLGLTNAEISKSKQIVRNKFKQKLQEPEIQSMFLAGVDKETIFDYVYDQNKRDFTDSKFDVVYDAKTKIKKKDKNKKISALRGKRIYTHSLLEDISDCEEEVIPIKLDNSLTNTQIAKIRSLVYEELNNILQVFKPKEFLDCTNFIRLESKIESVPNLVVLKNPHRLPVMRYLESVCKYSYISFLDKLHRYCQYHREITPNACLIYTYVSNNIISNTDSDKPVRAESKFTIRYNYKRFNKFNSKRITLAHGELNLFIKRHIELQYVKNNYYSIRTLQIQMRDAINSSITFLAQTYNSIVSVLIPRRLNCWFEDRYEDFMQFLRAIQSGIREIMISSWFRNLRDRFYTSFNTVERLFILGELPTAHRDLLEEDIETNSSHLSYGVGIVLLFICLWAIIYNSLCFLALRANGFFRWMDAQFEFGRNSITQALRELRVISDSAREIRQETNIARENFTLLAQGVMMGSIENKYRKILIDMKNLLHTLYYLYKKDHMTALGFLSNILVARSQSEYNEFINILPSFTGALTIGAVSLTIGGVVKLYNYATYKHAEQQYDSTGSYDTDDSDIQTESKLDVGGLFAKTMGYFNDNSSLSIQAVENMNKLYTLKGHQFRECKQNVDFFMGILSLIIRALTGFDLEDPVSSRYASDTLVLCKKMSEFRAGPQQDAVLRSSSKMLQFESFYDSLSSFKLNPRHALLPSYLTSTFDKLYDECTVLMRKIKAKQHSSKGRRTPLCTLLLGPPGVGKSTIMDLCKKGICHIECIEYKRQLVSTTNLREIPADSIPTEYTPEMTYTFNSGQEYWEGYNQQKFVDIDDIWCRADTEIRAYEASSIIHMVNTAPKSLNMAFESKGSTFFDSEYIFCSSNIADYGIKLANLQLGMTSNDAVLRRCHVILHKVTQNVDCKSNDSYVRVEVCKMFPDSVGKLIEVKNIPKFLYQCREVQKRTEEEQEITIDKVSEILDNFDANTDYTLSPTDKPEINREFNDYINGVPQAPPPMKKGKGNKGKFGLDSEKTTLHSASDTDEDDELESLEECKETWTYPLYYCIRKPRFIVDKCIATCGDEMCNETITKENMRHLRYILMQLELSIISKDVYYFHQVRDHYSNLLKYILRVPFDSNPYNYYIGRFKRIPTTFNLAYDYYRNVAFLDETRSEAKNYMAFIKNFLNSPNLYVLTSSLDPPYDRNRLNNLYDNIAHSILDPFSDDEIEIIPSPDVAPSFYEKIKNNINSLCSSAYEHLHFMCNVLTSYFSEEEIQYLKSIGTGLILGALAGGLGVMGYELYKWIKSDDVEVDSPGPKKYSKITRHKLPQTYSEIKAHRAGKTNVRGMRLNSSSSNESTTINGSMILLMVLAKKTRTSPLDIQSTSSFHIKDGYCLTAAHFLLGYLDWEDVHVVAVWGKFDADNPKLCALPNGYNCPHNYQFDMVLKKDDFMLVEGQDVCMFRLFKDGLIARNLPKSTYNMIVSCKQELPIGMGMYMYIYAIDRENGKRRIIATCTDGLDSLSYVTHGKSIMVRMPIWYNGTTGTGVSGGPLSIYGDQGSPLIIGMHFGSDKRKSCKVGASIPICKEFADALIKLYDPDLESTPSDQPIIENNSKVEYIPLTITARVPSHKSMTIYRKDTSIRPAATFECFGEHKQIPVFMSKFENNDGVVVDPLIVSLSKRKQVHYPEQYFDKNRIMSELKRYYPRVPKCEVLDIDRAVSGQCNFPAKGIDLSTSPGYPWNLKYTNGKKTLVQNNEGVYTIDSEFRNHVLTLHDKILEEGKTNFIWADVFKEETREIDKVLAGKTRLISICPIDCLILWRMYFLDFIAYVQTLCNVSFVSVGINAHSIDWTLLHDRLLSKNHNVVSGDFSNFDGSVPKYIFEFIVEFINEWYNDSEDNKKMRRILCQDIHTSTHLIGDLIYEVCDGIPSGIPPTAVFNSFASAIMFMIVIHHDLNLNISDTALATYGDDSLIAIKDQRLSCGHFAPHLKRRFNMTFTHFSKTDSLDHFDTLDTISYLGRGFRKELSVYRAPLSIEVIKEMLYWTSSNQDEMLVLMSTIRSFYIELSHHPKEIFYKYTLALDQWLLDNNKSHIHYMMHNHNSDLLSYYGYHEAMFDPIRQREFYYSPN